MTKPMNAFNIVMIAIGICAAAVLTALLKGAIAAGKDKSRDTAKCPVCGKVFPVLSDDETTTFGYHLRVGSPCGEKFLHDWMMGLVPYEDAELKTERLIEQEKPQSFKDYLEAQTERYYIYFEGDDWYKFDKKRRKRK